MDLSRVIRDLRLESNPGGCYLGGIGYAAVQELVDARDLKPDFPRLYTVALNCSKAQSDSPIETWA
jgi:hypothetical protein